VEQYTAAYTSR